MNSQHNTRPRACDLGIVIGKLWYQAEYKDQDSVHYEQREKEVKIARQYRKAFEGFMESLSRTFDT